MVKLQAIRQWLQKRGLDPTGDRETCAKRLQEAMKIDQVGLPPALEPIGKLMQRLIKLLKSKNQVTLDQTHSLLQSKSLL